MGRSWTNTALSLQAYCVHNLLTAGMHNPDFR